jgi:hypothetical protein
MAALDVLDAVVHLDVKLLCVHISVELPSLVTSVAAVLN